MSQGGRPNQQSGYVVYSDKEAVCVPLAIADSQKRIMTMDSESYETKEMPFAYLKLVYHIRCHL